MDDTGRRKLSARQIVADIRSGLEDSELKHKFGLSDKELQSVYRKLVAWPEHCKRTRSRTDSHQPVLLCRLERRSKQRARRCPACHASQDKAVDECPVCGLIVAKFVSRQAESSRPVESIGSPHSSESDKPDRNRSLPAAIIALVVIVMAGALFMWSTRPTERMPEMASVGTASEIPKETETKTVNIEEPTQETGEDQPAPAAEVEIGESAETEVDSQPSAIAQEPRRTVPSEETPGVVELQFSREGFPLGLSVSEGFALHLFETPSPSQGFKKLPPETDSKRYDDEFRIGGQTYRVLTEASNPPQLYLDGNRNGDLTDDPGPFVGEGPSVAPNHYTLELPYKGEDKGVPYRIWIFPSRMGGIRFYPKCYWRGELVINGKTYTLIMFDANSDGDYSNDPLIIDINDDGKADETEKLKPGQSLDIDGTTVKLLAIAPSGRWVRLEF